MATQRQSYSQTNDELIKRYNLQPHPEGGFFTLSWLPDERIATPFVEDAPERTLASSIYYLLAPRTDAQTRADVDKLRNGDAAQYIVKEGQAIRWTGHKAVFHLNKSSTIHLHHQGRARYTLIEAAPQQGAKPQIKQVIVGDDLSRGETRQLVVEGGDRAWWKLSELLEEDLDRARDGDESVRCLISEVVIPGFDWKDHCYMRASDLRRLFADDEDSIARFLPYVASDEHQ